MGGFGVTGAMADEYGNHIQPHIRHPKLAEKKVVNVYFMINNNTMNVTIK